jgi:hypothetical protein
MPHYQIASELNIPHTSAFTNGDWQRDNDNGD